MFGSDEKSQENLKSGGVPLSDQLVQFCFGVNHHLNITLVIDLNQTC